MFYNISMMKYQIIYKHKDGNEVSYTQKILEGQKLSAFISNLEHEDYVKTILNISLIV